MRILVRHFHEFWVFKSLKTFKTPFRLSSLGRLSLIEVIVILSRVILCKNGNLDQYVFIGFEPQELRKISNNFKIIIGENRPKFWSYLFFGEGGFDRHLVTSPNPHLAKLLLIQTQIDTAFLKTIYPARFFCRSGVKSIIPCNTAAHMNSSSS